MSRYHPSKDLSPIFDAADTIKQRCFLSDGSIFSEKQLWRGELVAEVRAAFWENEGAIKDSYIEKLKFQMKTVSADGKQLMAELNWFLQLFITSSKPSTKREQIQSMWAWSGDMLPDSHPMLSDEVLAGIGHPGAAYNTMRWRELNYLFDVVDTFKACLPDERTSLLSDPWVFHDWLATVPSEGYRQFRHMLRYMFFPDTFERITVSKHKREFIHMFLGDDLRHLNDLDDFAIDKKLFEARRKMEVSVQPFDFYKEAKTLEEKAAVEQEVPRNITREHLLKAIERIDKEGVPAGAQSISYDVVFNDKRYPPKLVVALANFYANGHELDRSEFGGGMNTPCFNLLAKEGFKIEPRKKAIRISLVKILEGFSEAKKAPLKDHPLAALIRTELPSLIKESIFEDDAHLTVTGTKFVGRWANVPWIAALDTRITRTTQKGIYAVMLFSESGDQLFFTIAQGVTKQSFLENADNRRLVLASLSPPPGYSDGPLADERLGTSNKAKSYAASVIFYKAFGKDDLPNDEAIADELRQLRSLLDRIAKDPSLNPSTTGEDDDFEETGELEEEPGLEPFTFEDALQDLYLDEVMFRQMLGALMTKKNIIVQGPPGVGKTFLCKRLSHAAMGFKDDDRIEMVQFHQSYTYEDFVLGFRPTKEGLRLRKGCFFKFCERAKDDPDNIYVFIIDEINRGNLSKIFGELLMLVERDKRGSKFAIRLAYAEDEDEKFFVPGNVHLIGLMNTADRSLALVDYALRRRFSFFSLKPSFDNSKFKSNLMDHGASKELIERIVSKLTALNSRISKEEANLGAGFCIGHSYFCPTKTGGNFDTDWYNEVIRFEIEPLIREYWFDDEETATSIVQDLLAQ